MLNKINHIIELLKDLKIVELQSAICKLEQVRDELITEKEKSSTNNSIKKWVEGQLWIK